ncbi:Chromosome transmission fidelity protein 18 [Elasticomyces elasticus]|uniref:Chromosome transmission fidelity protein 18 n=1 Tax=Exophiala sideris TaxID=1016849 RepID=A0ABR0JSD5_9EURO|nr:Chromosome transmission fidelity protein 18 [Elasticomyces elasticus]KAK5040478.1 Chromosome transmission fidelity protein 18 [Exophiala sideris]KAK5043096.1 Chromosome transmission fidelity protein 18 [Exophiala sideris]KAK5068856.1 Chromosome transmission fidelity protein 18 [Exophiala sideris]KAK5186452.1 Chromosome transmission fidelity protein 18 [Eurotiomycetes sp. CCFEE 6388]
MPQVVYESPSILPSCPNSSDLEPIYQQHEHDAKSTTGEFAHVHSDELTLATSFSEDLPSTSESVPEEMPFSSSPVLYPPSSSPPVPAATKKRKLFQPFPTELQKKRPKIVGGFLEDSDAEEEQPENVRAQSRPPQVRLNDEQTLPPLPVSLTEVVTTKANGTADPKEQQAPFGTALPAFTRPLLRRLGPKTICVNTLSGATLSIPLRQKSSSQSYEQLVAGRSTTKEGRAKRAYYGIEIHQLVDDAKTQRQLGEFEKQRKSEEESVQATVETPLEVQPANYKSTAYQMWTEKYRAKKFTELVGDERTHRGVLRWLKSWDDVVFPGHAKLKPVRVYDDKDQPEQQHRKILLLTGPPGLGKTTLAHVCAKQAGYEVLEINASDDRSRDVVKGRIKDALGTETVRGIKEHGKARKAGRPVCLVVDEVDGVTTGSASSGGEGGFIKALIDLVQLDQRNSSQSGNNDNVSGRKKKGDRFRMLRPLILVCNDVYAPSLRPLRTSSIAEIVHVRKAPIDKVIARVKHVFEKEYIACDNDAVRRLCENAWGLAMRKQRGPGSRGSGEGDIRGVLVQAEWIAHKLRAHGTKPRLTKKWLEPQLEDAQAGQKGLARGGVREVVERVFLEGAGLPNLTASLSAEDARLVAESKTNLVGVAELRKRSAIAALREMVDTCGDHDRVVADCFATYPTKAYQDDVQLSKPNASYDWLHFHDCLSSRVFSGQEWELTPYLSTSACGFHHLFAAVDKGSNAWNDEKPAEESVDVHPFSGFKADFAAYEAEKQNRTLLTELQSSFSGSLLRLFSSVNNIATELIPNVGKMLAPDVKPVTVGGSGGSASVASVRKDTEKVCIKNAVRTMLALDLSFEKIHIEIEGGGAHSNGGYAYRMEPPLDTLLSFHMDKEGQSVAPVRYAVRQVLDQELRKEKLLQNSAAKHARSGPLTGMSVADGEDDKENEAPVGKAKETLATDLNAKRDFFGRIINESRPLSAGKAVSADMAKVQAKDEGRIWVSFHEGFSNAVRKPITLKELLDGF